MSIRETLMDFRRYCKARGYDEADICADIREQFFVKQRRDIVAHMLNLGHTLADIGHVMDKHPDTIKNLSKTKPPRKKRCTRRMDQKKLAARIDFKALCKQMDVTMADMESAHRDQALVENRAMIAKAMRKKGHSYPVIGHAMNRDHTSIIYLVNDRRREYRRTQMKAYAEKQG